MIGAAAIDAAAAASPVLQRLVPGRVLLVDGDALAYTCAGSDSCTPGQARANLLDRVAKARALSGADTVEILLTGSGSPKGGRYAFATVKPYQGQRSSGRRPVQWRYLRDLLESGQLPYPVTTTETQEADDLFHVRSYQLGADKVAIHTQDKDLRSVPGWHITWDDFHLTFLPTDTLLHEFNGKVYGAAWFWLQMLHGDTADNIPGLPGFVGGVYASGPHKGKPKVVRCGPNSSLCKQVLEEARQGINPYPAVLGGYQSYYGEDAHRHLLEQALLLYMQHTPFQDAVLTGRGFLAPYAATYRPLFEDMKKEIHEADRPHTQDVA